jgi:HNH endonuclease
MLQTEGEKLVMIMPGGGAIRGAKQTATLRGLEATLQTDDWRQTCADQEYRCVYCERAIRSGDGTIEHFIPVASNGGTSIDNCLLACRPCNLAKADLHPEQFLLNNPEKLARIRAYLTLRRPGQGFQSFWSLPLPEKEEPMTDQRETRITSYTLTSGIELHVRNTQQQIALQLRQPPVSENELLGATDFQLGTILTLPECVALTQTLLSCIATRLEESRKSA